MLEKSSAERIVPVGGGRAYRESFVGGERRRWSTDALAKAISSARTEPLLNASKRKSCRFSDVRRARICAPSSIWGVVLDAREVRLASLKGNPLGRWSRSLGLAWLTSSSLLLGCTPTPMPVRPVPTIERKPPAELTLLQLDGLSHAVLQDYIDSIPPADRASSALAKLLDATTDESGKSVTRGALFVPDGNFHFSVGLPASRVFIPEHQGASEPAPSNTGTDLLGSLDATVGYDFDTGAGFQALGESDEERITKLVDRARVTPPRVAAIRLDTIPTVVRRAGLAALRPSLKRIDDLLGRVAQNSALLDRSRRFVIITSAYGLRPTATAARVVTIDELAQAAGSAAVRAMGGVAVIGETPKGNLGALQAVPGVDRVLFRDGPSLYMYAPELGALRPLTNDELHPRLAQAWLELTHPGDSLVLAKRDGCDFPEANRCFTVEASKEPLTHLIRGGLTRFETNVPLFIVGPDTSYAQLDPLPVAQTGQLIGALINAGGAEQHHDVARLLHRIRDVQYHNVHPSAVACETGDPNAEQSCEQFLVRSDKRSQIASVLNRLFTARQLEPDQQQDLARISAWLSFSQSTQDLPEAMAAFWPSRVPNCTADAEGIVDLTGKHPQCNLHLSAELPEPLLHALAVAVADAAGGYVALVPGDTAQAIQAVASTPTLERLLGPRYIALKAPRASTHAKALAALAKGFRHYEEGSLGIAFQQLELADKLPGAAADWRRLFLDWTRSDLGETQGETNLVAQPWMGMISKVRDITRTGMDSSPEMDQDLAKLSQVIKDDKATVDPRVYGQRVGFVTALQSIRKVQFPESRMCSLEALQHRVIRADPKSLQEAIVYFERLGQPGLAADAYIRLAYAEQDGAEKNRILVHAIDQLKQPAAAWVRWPVGLRILNVFSDDRDTLVAREYATKFLLLDAQRRMPLLRDPIRIADAVVLPLLAAGVDPARIKSQLNFEETPRPPFDAAVKRLLNAYMDPLAVALQMTDLKGLSTRLLRTLNTLAILYPRELEEPSTAAQYIAAVGYPLAKGGQAHFDGDEAVAKESFAAAAQIALTNLRLAQAGDTDSTMATLVGLFALGTKALVAKDLRSAKEDADVLLKVVGQATASALATEPAARERVGQQLETVLPVLRQAVYLGLAAWHDNPKAVAEGQRELARIIARHRPVHVQGAAPSELDHWLDVLDVVAKDVVIAMAPKGKLSPELKRAHGDAIGTADRLWKTWKLDTVYGRYALQALLAAQDVVANWRKIDGVDSLMVVGRNLFNLADNIADDIDRAYTPAELRQLLLGRPDLFQLAAAAYKAYHGAIRAKPPRDLEALGSLTKEQIAKLFDTLRDSNRGGPAKVLLAMATVRLSTDPQAIDQAVELGRRWAKADDVMPDLFWELEAAQSDVMKEKPEAAIERIDRVAQQCPTVAADLMLDKAYLEAEAGRYDQAAEAARHYLTEARHQGGAALQARMEVKSASGAEIISAMLNPQVGAVRATQWNNTFQFGLGLRGKTCCSDADCTPCDQSSSTDVELDFVWTDSTAQASIRAGSLVSLYHMLRHDQKQADLWLGNVPDLFFGKDPLHFALPRADSPSGRHDPNAVLTGDPVTLLWLATVAELNGFVGLAQEYFLRAKLEANNGGTASHRPTHKLCTADPNIDVLVEMARCEEPRLFPSASLTSEMRELVHARVLAFGDPAKRGGKYVRLVRHYSGPLLPAWAGGVAAAVMSGDAALLDSTTPADVADRLRVRYGKKDDEDLARYAQSLSETPCEGADAVLTTALRGRTIKTELLVDLVNRCDSSTVLFRTAQLVAANMDRVAAFGLWITAAAHLRVAPLLGDATQIWARLLDSFWAAPDLQRAELLLESARESRALTAIVEAHAFIQAVRVMNGERADRDADAEDLVAQGHGDGRAQELVRLIATQASPQALHDAGQRYVESKTRNAAPRSSN
jgi:hypothetical protein